MSTKEDPRKTNITMSELEVDFQLLFESAPTPHLVVRADPPRFTIVAATDSYLSATNKKREDLIGLGIFEAFPDNPVDTSTTGMNDVRTSIERTLQTGAEDILGIQRYDVPIKVNGNTEFTVKYWSAIHTPVYDRQNNIAFILQRVEDVTEYVLLKEKKIKESMLNEKINSLNDQGEAEILRMTRAVKEANQQIKFREQELERLNERLKELDRAKTEFFSNVSHEFRTPLTLMLGPIEELLHSQDLSQANKTQLDVLQRNALRLLKLVNTLLDFSRLEADRIQVSFSPHDLTKLTAELAAHFDSAVERAGLMYIINCTPLPEPIYIDPNLWDKIVLNLLSNAFKHTFEGKIEIQLGWVNNYAVLTVEDTGIGIAAKEIPHLFERFYRVANAKSRTHEGSGIGLALVNELVKIHHGTIEVKSVEGQGTTFIISIPSGKDHLPPHLIKATSSLPSTEISAQAFVEEVVQWLPQEESLLSKIEIPGHAQEYWLGINPNESRKAIILLVDDNRDMRNYIFKLLSPFCEVRTATDGLDALNTIRQHQVDLILSDVMMPNMNGFELLSNIRKDKDLQFIPFILISARAGEEAKVEGLQMGADDYLIKPFNARELLARVKSNLDHHRERSKINAELKSISKFKSQFISNMSHELRTPLNAIIGYSEMILQGMVDSPDMQYRLINNISSAGRHLLDLINDILDLSIIEAGKIVLKLEWIELHPFLSNIHALLYELAAKKQISLHFQVQPNLNFINADPVRLKQILINLINNAIKFNKPQGQINVQFYLSQDNLSIIGQVKDTGIGIPEDKLDALFTEFFKIESEFSNAQEGTGLGLALTQRFVKLHGGTISVESQIGNGTTFTFTLPYIFPPAKLQDLHS
jgi:signal transduction histidine kinase